MCLIIDKKFETEKEANEFSKKPLIAEVDIKVYKVINKGNLSPYREFKYEKGWHYYQKSKNNPFTFNIYQNWWENTYNLSVLAGLHSFKNFKDAQDEASWNYDSKAIKMIIPKGAKYFEGVWGGDEDIEQYVSSELIWY